MGGINSDVRLITVVAASVSGAKLPILQLPLYYRSQEKNLNE